jgi:hypothetical protein
LGFVQAKDVQAPVTISDFDVTIVRPEPPIDQFKDLDLTLIEMNSFGYREPVIVRIELDSNTHDWGCRGPHGFRINLPSTAFEHLVRGLASASGRRA